VVTPPVPDEVAAAGLLDCVDDAIVVLNASLVLTYVNAAARSSFSHTSSRPVVGLGGLEFLHADDVPTVSAAIAELLTEPNARRIFTMRLRDGDVWMPVEATATNRIGQSGIDGIVVCFRRVAREMAQTRLAQDLKMALDMSSDAVILHATDGTVLYANPAARSMIRIPDVTVGWPYRAPVTTALTEFILPSARLEGRWSGDIEVRDGFGVLRCLSLAITTPTGTEDNGTVLITARDVTDRRAQEQEHAVLAFRDELTGLPNRAALQRHLDELFTNPRPVRTVAALFVDLDRFKAVNDTLGHQCGDELLTMVASRLNTVLRSGETLARLGGDEFVVVITQEDSAPVLAARADELAQHALKMLTAPMTIGANDIYLSASIGVAYNSETGCTAGELLRHADLAMFRAKNLGRSRVVEFTPALAEHAERHLHLETALHRALDNRELAVLYQPIIRLDGGTKQCFEALVRWRGPDGILHTPDVFLDVAEQSDLVTRLDTFVLQQACADLSLWVGETSDTTLTVSVNVSSRQLCRPEFATLVTDTLQDTGVAAQQLVIEVTETNLIADLPAALETVRRLRELGVGIAIDDFGTGYCSMNYLRMFKADTLKIDRSFVANATHNTEDAQVIGAITQLAATFGMDTVAEGVETEEQLAMLESIGCSAAQGFLLDLPLSAETINARLAAILPSAV
jgi:diguanylate cyclase (GGDEF)-like protein